MTDKRLDGAMIELAAARRLVSEVDDYGAMLSTASKGPQLSDEAPMVMVHLDEYHAIIRTLDELGVHIDDEELGTEDGERRTVSFRSDVTTPDDVDLGFTLEMFAARRIIDALRCLGFDSNDDAGAEVATAMDAYDLLVSDLDKSGARYATK